jgi:hypothetical protein
LAKEERKDGEFVLFQSKIKNQHSEIINQSAPRPSLPHRPEIALRHRFDCVEAAVCPLLVAVWAWSVPRGPESLREAARQELARLPQ